MACKHGKLKNPKGRRKCKKASRHGGRRRHASSRSARAAAQCRGEGANFRRCYNLEMGH